MITFRRASAEIEKIASSNDLGGHPELKAIVSHWLQSPGEKPIYGRETERERWLESVVSMSMQLKQEEGRRARVLDPSRMFDYSDIPFPPVTGQDFSFIDLFAGIGGFRLAFQNAGGKCVFSSEWDKYSQKTYEANFGEIPFGDITTIPASVIPDHDVLLAGFPCQAFSQAGLKKGFLDTRGTMFFEIQRILAEKRPKVVILENVKQLRGHNKGATLDTILRILRGENAGEIDGDIPMSEDARRALSTPLNYHVEFKILRAGDFGVPQNRERIFIVGIDRDFQRGKSFEEAFHWPVPPSMPTRLGDILEDSEALDGKFTIGDRLWEGHVRRKEQHRLKGNGFGYSLFNQESEYANTISARYYKDGSEILIDQAHLGRNPRRLTPRECARLQGFPEEFIVDAVSQNRIYRQFGNSVAVPVVSAIADEVARLLTGNVMRETHFVPLNLLGAVA